MKVTAFILLLSVFSVITYAQKKDNPSNYKNYTDSSGKKQGLWIEENCLKELYYRNGIKNGLFKSYFRKNGKLSSFGEYLSGGKNGVWFYFDEASHLIMQELIKGENSAIEIKRDDGVMIKPKYVSEIVLYYLNGTVKAKGLAIFDEDIEIDFFKKGLWEYYNEQGKLIKKEEY